MRLSKKTLKRLQKFFNSFVIMMMLIQPVGTPGLMVAMAAENDVAPVVAQSAPASDSAPEEKKKEDVTPAPEVKKEEPVPIIKRSSSS